MLQDQSRFVARVFAGRNGWIADHGPLIRGGDLNRRDAEERRRNTE
jgi:hypothetical protein